MNAYIHSTLQALRRAQRSIRFHCLIPPMSPHTELGAVAARAYAQIAGQTFEDFVSNFVTSTPADIGAAVVALQRSRKVESGVVPRVRKGFSSLFRHQRRSNDGGDISSVAPSVIEANYEFRKEDI